MRFLFRWTPAHPERWLFGLALLVYTAPTIWKLGVSDSMYHMEQMVLLPSQETWIRQQAGDQQAWLTPTMRGQPRIRKPPMVIWLNMLAWTGLDSETVSHSVLTSRARMVAWLLGFLGICATAWMGRMIYNPVIGVRSALVLASVYSILKQGRMATFDTHLLGWIPLTLALSLALARRRVTGTHLLWLFLGGMTSSAAFLTKGAVAVLYLLPALLLIAVFTPKERIRLVNLFLPFCIGLFVYGLWLWDVLRSVPGASDVLSAESMQSLVDPQPVYYYVITIALVFPWTLLVIGLFPEMKKWRWSAAVPWLAFLVGILLLTIPDNRRQRYLIPLFPLFALGFSHLWSLRSGKWMAGFARAHVLVLTLLSIVLPLLIPFQAELVEAKVFKDTELPGAGLFTTVGMLLVLVPLCLLMLRSAFRLNSRFLVPLTAVWIALVYTVGMHFYVHSYHGVYEHREESERLHDDSADAQGIRYFSRFRELGSDPPDDRFLYHSGRYFQPVQPDTAFESGSLVLIPARQERRFPSTWLNIGTYQERRPYTLMKVP